ncbi:MAG: Mu-like prophage major head subunit gpT family protein [Chloroflexi bacterium]|nr:Mu-like prophage major head subunit gpT family protein [Chloroflexota bacterium]
MPVSKSDIANLMLPGLRTEFQKAYATSPTPTYEQIATIIPSTLDTERYGWLGSVPKMREFLAERQIKGLNNFDFSIKNKTWESTIGVERAAIEDDQTGALKLQVQTLAQEARRHPDELVMNLLINSYAANTQPITLCYDGLSLVHAAHLRPDGTNGQCNYFNVALSAATLKANISAMMNFKDDTGKPLNLIPDTLVVGPELMWTAMELLEMPGVVTATPSLSSNVLQGKLKLVVNPYLSGDYDVYWYTLCTSSIRPLIFQNRLAPEFTSMEAESESGFMRDTYAYGVRARYNAGAGFWPALIGNIVTT